jgi:hypothetical protein
VGADPSQIHFEYEGAVRVSIAEDGDLIVSIEAGEPREQAPVIFQNSGSWRDHVNGRYRMLGPRTVGFEIETYDITRPLVINPVISYCILAVLALGPSRVLPSIRLGIFTLRVGQRRSISDRGRRSIPQTRWSRCFCCQTESGGNSATLFSLLWGARRRSRVWHCGRFGWSGASHRNNFAQQFPIRCTRSLNARRRARCVRP